jgi:hypothetical protein
MIRIFLKTLFRMSSITDMEYQQRLIKERIEEPMDLDKGSVSPFGINYDKPIDTLKEPSKYSFRRRS